MAMAVLITCAFITIGIVGALLSAMLFIEAFLQWCDGDEEETQTTKETRK